MILVFVYKLIKVVLSLWFKGTSGHLHSNVVKLITKFMAHKPLLMSIVVLVCVSQTKGLSEHEGGIQIEKRRLCVQRDYS
jgi:hypothetical protein